MDDEDREFEHSPLSGALVQDGEEIDVEIYRFANTQDRWRLEVVHFSGCTQWQDTFATDAEAYAAFITIVEAAGIASFVGDRPKVRN